MDPWAFLGIEVTQDERAIKRAYSKLLLIHRPDGDQTAFQKLRYAYETALHLARKQANPAAARRVASVDLGATPSADSVSIPSPIVPPPRVVAARPAPLAATHVPDGPGEVLRTVQEVADAISSGATSLQADSAGFRAFLAAVPEMFNLDTKLAVSATLARRIAAGRLFPAGPMSGLSTFFEWDTFAEQRRLVAMGIQVTRLRTLLSSEDLQRYLAEKPRRVLDPDVGRHWLKILRVLNQPWWYWLFAMVNLPWRKTVRAALNQAIGRFGHPVIEDYLGKGCLQFWARFYSTTPTLVQGGVYGLRAVTLASLGTIGFILVDRLNLFDYVLAAAVPGVLEIGAVMAAWWFLAWSFKAVSFWTRRALKAGPLSFLPRLLPARIFEPVARGIVYLRQPKALLGVSMILWAIALFWPATLSPGYFMLLVLPFVLITWLGYRALVALFLLSIGWGFLAAPKTTAGDNRFMALGWPLMYFYVQWGCGWLAPRIRTQMRWRHPDAVQLMVIMAAMMIVLSVVLAIAKS